MRTGRDSQNRLLINIVIGSVLAVLLFTGVFRFMLYRAEQKEVGGKQEENIEYTNETEVYHNQNLSAEKRMLNAAPPAYPEDTREVFRIIEVIPHEVCSIFPYMIDWKTEEEYEKNVPIGYEGVRLIAMHQNWEFAGVLDRIFSGDNASGDGIKLYSYKKEIVRRDYLTNYQNTIGVSSQKDKWYRVTAPSGDPVVYKNGYFEYVGAGKGLYHINLSYTTGTSGGEGIRYEVQAQERKKSAAARGELYVSSPAYYKAKDHQFSNDPDIAGIPVKSKTDYNYDLYFGKNSIGSYRADINNAKDKTTVSESNDTGWDFDYFLVIDENKGDIRNWESGFFFFKNGNYAIDTIQESSSGKYVRMPDVLNSDGAVGVDRGYFVRYNHADTGQVGLTRYDVTFKHSASGNGFYVVIPPTDFYNNEKADAYYFDYMGEGKGQYDVAFLYTEAGDVVRYKEELVEVTHRQGRYALTSTEAENNAPVYKSEGNERLPRDYGNIITNISFKNIVNGSGSNDEAYKGLTLGGDDGANEAGGWVFRVVEDSSRMQDTKLNDASSAVGSKIYVRNQERRVRYYEKTEALVSNNEFFKLLCCSNASDNPDDPQPYTFGNRTQKEIMESAEVKRMLDAFDSTYRIEIIQRTPDELRESEVRNADLIYISDMPGIEELKSIWGNISDFRKSIGLDTLPQLPSNSELEQGNHYKFHGDFSPQVLFAIYDECVYKRSCALLMNAYCQGKNDKAETNLEKLYAFTNYFHDSQDFAKFMPWYSDYNELYTKIVVEGNDVYALPVPSKKHNDNNLYNTEAPEEGTEKKLVWDIRYFRVPDPANPWGRALLPAGQDGNGWNYRTTVQQNYDINGETNFITSQYAPEFFEHNNQYKFIWEILQNRKSNTGIISVVVTNGEKLRDVAGTKVIYADEFDPNSFNIDYEITMVGGSGARPALSEVTLSYVDGDVPYSAGGYDNPLYDNPYTTNVRSGFSIDHVSIEADPLKPLNPAVTMRELVITARTADNKSGTANVWVVVREAFDLN